jgi:hypothetical protein
MEHKLTDALIDYWTLSMFQRRDDQPERSSEDNYYESQLEFIFHGWRREMFREIITDIDRLLVGINACDISTAAHHTITSALTRHAHHLLTLATSIPAWNVHSSTVHHVRCLSDLHLRSLLRSLRPINAPCKSILHRWGLYWLVGNVSSRLLLAHAAAATFLLVKRALRPS